MGSSPKLSKWTKALDGISVIKGSKFAVPKSTVWTWQQWQLQNGGHKSASIPCEWLASKFWRVFAVICESDIICEELLSLQANKFRPNTYRDSMNAIIFTIQI